MGLAIFFPAVDSPWTSKMILGTCLLNGRANRNLRKERSTLPLRYEFKGAKNDGLDEIIIITSLATLNWPLGRGTHVPLYGFTEKHFLHFEEWHSALPALELDFRSTWRSDKQGSELSWFSTLVLIFPRKNYARNSALQEVQTSLIHWWNLVKLTWNTGDNSCKMLGDMFKEARKGFLTARRMDLKIHASK